MKTSPSIMEGEALWEWLIKDDIPMAVNFISLYNRHLG